MMAAIDHSSYRDHNMRKNKKVKLQLVFLVLVLNCVCYFGNTEKDLNLREI